MQTVMEKRLEGTVLEELMNAKDSWPVRAFRLRVPGGQRLTAATFLFSPVGVVITRENNLGVNGIISRPGYGLNWFIDELDEAALCDRFLRKTYDSSHAKAYLAARVEALGAVFDEMILKGWGAQAEVSEVADTRQTIRELLAHYHQKELEAPDFYAFLSDTLSEDPKGQGDGFSPSDAGWLCALQKRFRALYIETKPSLRVSRQG